MLLQAKLLRAVVLLRSSKHSQPAGQDALVELPLRVLVVVQAARLLRKKACYQNGIREACL